MEGGFCPLHTWQLLSVSSSQGLSIGYPRLLDRLCERLNRLSKGPDKVAELWQHVAPRSGNCRVCRILHETEDVCIRTLVEHLASAEGKAAYARSQGLCLQHLRAVLPHVQARELAVFLLREAARHFEEWSEEMQNYAMKRDAIRRHLVNRDENDAYLRAIVHLVGERGVCTPWDTDVEI